MPKAPDCVDGACRRCAASCPQNGHHVGACDCTHGLCDCAHKESMQRRLREQARLHLANKNAMLHMLPDHLDHHRAGGSPPRAEHHHAGGSPPWTEHYHPPAPPLTKYHRAPPQRRASALTVPPWTEHHSAHGTGYHPAPRAPWTEHHSAHGTEHHPAHGTAPGSTEYHTRVRVRDRDLGVSADAMRGRERRERR